MVAAVPAERALKKSLNNLRDRSITWLGSVRLRVIVLVIGLPLAIMGVVSVGPAWLALPLVGMTVAAITMTIGRVTSRLGDHVCWTCGHDLAQEPQGVHGVACPGCGSLNQHNPLWRNDLLADPEQPGGDVGGGVGGGVGVDTPTERGPHQASV